MTQLGQHQVEIEKNFAAWQRKPLLQEIYTGFYKRILPLINPAIPGHVVELGSGIGNLKEHLPSAITSDLFPNPWLDVVCDAYHLPFRDAGVSHLILFDVFHHLRYPAAFFKEARRVLNGRLILFEPFMSWTSLPVYGLLHHEPVAWGDPIDAAETPREIGYYAAQGNATRMFFPGKVKGWRVMRAEAFSAFHYLLSGGFSKPALYPRPLLKPLLGVDNLLTRWPRLFGSRCLIVLSPE
ncbi:MAG TPA: class I SAM-dependent methyltransferase [Verrucomicrobiae bacterium]|nr:class I SAM-dependent methyltransferase [Verrucomicrobiae bacterium]